MLIAPPFGLLAHDRVVSKDLSALADLAILQDGCKKVKNFFVKNSIFLTKSVKTEKRRPDWGALFLSSSD